jgi:hypothetical protein
VSLENLTDIPGDGVRMMADFISDSTAVDLLEVPGIERDVMQVLNSIESGNYSIDIMQLFPYAVGTLFMRFFQELPEKLMSQNLSPKFLWVQEVEIATLRYTMFRSLIFLLTVPHRNMAAFLFKWLRKMTEDPRKSMHYTSAYLGNIFGNLIMDGSDTAKAALTTQKLIEDYKHVFLDAEPDIRHFMKDGRQLVKWATVDRLIEKVVDPNCYDEQLAPMFFFCHMYFIEARDLLEKMVGIYLKCKIGPPATWKAETCKRITSMMRIWVENHGPALSNNEPFVSLMADFMKRRRDSADPDATEKELDRLLFHHRTQQNLIRTLPTRQLGNSGGKAKQLAIPSTIPEGPAQPDTLALLPSSAPNSPRANDAHLRTLVQTTSAHFTRTPPSPLNITYLNGSTGTTKPAAGKNPSTKAPTTPLPTSSPQPVPSLARNNRFTRGPIPPFSPSSSPPVRTSSPSRPRAISNASPLHMSSSPTVSPVSSPRNSPPGPSASVPPTSSSLSHSSSPPPPVSKYTSPTLSPVQSNRGRSFSKATAPEIVISEDSNNKHQEERKTIRYTTTFGALKGSIPRLNDSPILSSNYPSSLPAPTPLPLSSSNTLPTSPSSLPPSYSTSLPPSALPFSPPSMTYSASALISSRLSDSTNVISSDGDSSNLMFLIPKSTSVDSHLSNADGQVKRNRAYSVVQHGRSASAQLPLTGPTASTELIEIDPKVIAEHMTALDHECLKAIPMSELLQKNYMDPNKAPNFSNMAQKLNEWGLWTLKEILKHQELYDRVNALSLFIEISKECLSYNNFNSCCAILGALNNPAIQRLKNTWEKVNKKTMSKFRKMMELFDFTYNSKNYREALKITKPPAVPYLGLIPKDITSVEEIPTFVENGMCNIDKMRTLYKILCELQAFQKETYNFRIFPDFIARLKSFKDLYTDEEAYQRSLKIEPREIMTT